MQPGADRRALEVWASDRRGAGAEGEGLRPGGGHAGSAVGEGGKRRVVGVDAGTVALVGRRLELHRWRGISGGPLFCALPRLPRARHGRCRAGRVAATPRFDDRSVDAKTADDQRANLGDPLEVAVDVHDPEPVVERGLRDQEIRDRRAMPHAVVVSEVPLQQQCALEEIGRRRRKSRWGPQGAPPRARPRRPRAEAPARRSPHGRRSEGGTIPFESSWSISIVVRRVMHTRQHDGTCVSGRGHDRGPAPGQRTT